MLSRMSGHISLLTMEKCISLKCIDLFNFLARQLTYDGKVYQFEVYRLMMFFSHLLTYLGPLYQLKGVSATAEKRVVVFKKMWLKNIDFSNKIVKNT